MTTKLGQAALLAAMIFGVGCAADSAAKKEPAMDPAAAAPAAEPAPAAEAAPAAPEAAAANAEVTLSGTMTCAKCSLKETTACQNVLKVGEGGAEVKYYLADNDVAKENHKPVCAGSKPATVKGTVSEKDGKKELTASSITYQ